ncbi:rRNA maturation RNase YbeY [Marinospirillum sp. MEB164]|uniref:Endoribonuclease YbeY n=1 Tax=Marinospirillum alkalitolerans TaxID=3123374 RepID=A0ABW8PXF7_9GAMM
MIELDLQIATQAADEVLPSLTDLQSWLDLAYPADQPATEVTLRLVDEEESQALNAAYRGKDSPTNVLSFPFEAPIDLPPEAELSLLGDLVICVPKVLEEAQQQGKAPLHHWAHLVIHGLLHLQGWDHETEAEAEAMESHEVQLLAQLGIPDPYQAAKD